MKSKYCIAGLSAIALSTSAYADVTVNITGATAFRSATLLAIKLKYDASANYKFAHNTGAGNLSTANPNASTVIFSGAFPGLTGTTTIRCNFTGSVEGIRAVLGVTDPTPPKYYLSSVLSGTPTSTVGNVSEFAGVAATLSNTETATSDIAFSDVSIASTPYNGSPIKPSSPACGVIVFTMLANEGAKVTNVTSQQFRALMSKGYQPLSTFTGIANDDPASATPSVNARYVFGSGRNDGSGTRTVYLGETGYGITNTVKQYVVTNRASNAINSIQLVPVNGTTPAGYPTLPANTSVLNSTAYASNTWGQDVAGNGGYNSGSLLATDFGNTGASVTVFDEAGYLKFPTPVAADLVTWLSVNDAITAKNAGAVICSFNGVKLSSLVSLTATKMSAADTAKVTQGQYTAWGYENMYLRNDVTAGSNTEKVYNAIKSTIPLKLAAAGIKLTSMKAGRSEDFGTVVAP